MNEKVNFWLKQAEILEQSALWLNMVGQTERANERTRAAVVSRKRAAQEAEANK